MKSSELILNADGTVYHLALGMGDVAPQIITVGDPERLDMFVPYLDEVLLRRQKREFHTLTGTYRGIPLSIMSTGIGTDNIDIVLTELDALFNIDLATRRNRDTFTSLKLLRLGTSGAIKNFIPLDSYVFSRYAIGADGLMEYYAHQPSYRIQDALTHFQEQHAPLPSGLYVTESATTTLPHLPEGTLQGITYTAKGFYGPQGRYIGRAALQFPDLVDKMGAFKIGLHETTNMEMETAGILGMAEALGHEAGSLSVILANRQLGTFSENPKAAVERLVKDGLEMMYKWGRDSQN
ncbi:MAG: nucleoside phosphorylase [Bacteroidota bacterium]